MLSAAELGVDSRAQALLEELPVDRQQAILQKLASDDKVRNPSAYVAAACRTPEALGIDERAAQLLNGLARHQRDEVLAKLKNTQGVQNPSAWVAKACLKASQHGGGGHSQVVPHIAPQYGAPQYGAPQYGQEIAYWQPVYVSDLRGGKGGGHGGAYGKGGKSAMGAFVHQAWAPPVAARTPQVDANANRLLQSLPAHTRREIMQKLENEGHSVRNPSAWVAKAALAAGATPDTAAVADTGYEVPELDIEAQELLSHLPRSDQEAIMAQLSASAGQIRNPSAYVVKAALRAGARPPARAGGGGSLPVLDAQATQLLESLPEHQQADILAKLEETQPRNPSGWVVKAAMNAGAKSQGVSVAGGGKGKGKMRWSPY